MSTDEASEAPEIQEMFVQVAHGATRADNQLTLEAVAPSTLYFADRPDRVVGHLSTRSFVDRWSEGQDSFATDPPNAVLAYLEPGDGVPEDAVVVLRDPTYDGSSLRYSIEVLEGSVPASAGPCSLFIDPIGRPLSPMSIAGVRRREERRTFGR